MDSGAASLREPVQDDARVSVSARQAPKAGFFGVPERFAAKSRQGAWPPRNEVPKNIPLTMMAVCTPRETL
jgi:hypothetical protein